MLCYTCKIRVRVLKSAYCKECKNEGSRLWRTANIEYVRAYNKKWNLANGGRKKDLWSKWYVSHRSQSIARTRAWIVDNPERARELAKGTTARRRSTKAGVLVEDHTDEKHCAICLGPLDPLAIWPDPMSTTVGHEPPLSRVKKLGVTIVIERPEHWECNVAKGRKLDSEMNLGR